MMFLSSTAYFPPVNWYLAALRKEAWLVEAFENFQKGGYRNRCRIATANGPRWLTVPLEKGKHQGLPIREVRISYRKDWVREHQQSIRSAYGRAPFFAFYGPPLMDLLASSELHLWSLNQLLLTWLAQHLQFPVPALPTDEYRTTLPPECLDWRSRKAAIPFVTPPYPQLFADRHGFQGDLSILDLLFCLGPEAGSYLRRRAT